VALKSNKNGTYTVTAKEDAVKALKLMAERQEAAQALMKKHKITELMQEATELKKAATEFCVAKGIEKLDLGDSYAGLREDGYDRRWIVDKGELVQFQLAGAANVIDLKTILKKKFAKKGVSVTAEFKEVWKRITKRVVDPDALQEAIDDGTLDEDEIAPAFVEKKKAPYLRIYPKS
jgi:hypothetical protein